ncbi:MAG: response regulator [Desulfobacula sp.]|jgi:two-component system chemotaxis response regulator CheY
MGNSDFDMRILIVDDSHSMLRIVKKFFENNGFHHIREAVNGIEALEIIRNENTVHLIVSDLNMPRMNGFELLKIVKDDSRTKDIPFVMLTVEAIQRTMNKAIAMGVDSYIVKPVTEKIFMDEIFRVIQSRSENLPD